MFSREDLRSLLYSRGNATRFTSDFPVLPDVWIAFAEQSPLVALKGSPHKPRYAVDLLITPDQTNTGPKAAFELAAYLHNALKNKESRHNDWPHSNIASRQLACHHFAVTVRMDFDELVRVILPRTKRWQEEIASKQSDIVDSIHEADGRKELANFLALMDLTGGTQAEISSDMLWMARVIGTIAELHWTVYTQKTLRTRQNVFDRLWPPPTLETGETSKELYDRLVIYYENIANSTARLVEGIDITPTEENLPYVAQVSLNRSVQSAVQDSTLAVKADAARRLFDIKCSHLTWAIVDNGIDASHPAFRDHPQANPDKIDWQDFTRITATYDFGQIRQLLSLDEDGQADFPDDLKQRLKRHPEIRKQLKESLLSGRTLDWDLVKPLIEVRHDDGYPVPESGHGTHVAGIMAADWLEDGNVRLQGICPDIRLMDFRVFDSYGVGDEFTVMAALQFLRHLNGGSSHRKVHGVNLSLSIKHEVANYACGNTPVCLECERLVGDGIVVVAAAGNDGYQVEDTFNASPAFRMVSITDPGNAETVITVGATHRQRPHTYGVSYFSSRGPTGDGRLKPDLVAPGEKITSCVPGESDLRQDGTSMAAPHVSGAAALLMGRYEEFVGDPRRIKRILCDTATDLGREMYFQGHGMLDILRALQSV
ncbi:S8 family peptidase [Thalassoroseus pseudoceratinae]|uniref:S8 family peptidase n=1 Tax=Thalassoroseus pseudoceratinae TaxID=2713176 RepID=UPI00142330C8|nr:S8 family peptidase [Thalassoroseus pseudoceratinae]